MTFTFRLILFLMLNFGALAIGGIFTSKGVNSDWYLNLNKAPWTPPGWVFGFAWTTIMICFSVYMAFVFKSIDNVKWLVLLFAIQWVLNVAWNPLFFYFHWKGISFLVIILLTLLIGRIMLTYFGELGWKSILILPYFLWLIVASSLNAYIWMKN